jgi:hypothetical protein
MKIMPLILMLSMFVTCGLSQVYTNGVFVDNGKTTEIEKKVYQFTPTGKSETLYFSNELIAEIYTNSDFSINGFFQEVYDINSTPHRARFGASSLSATLMNGTAVFTYSGTNDNSSCVISTPMTDIELHKGTFYFKVSENKVLVFVLEGSLKSHGDKGKGSDVSAGYAVIAVPNDIGILEAKISLGAEKVKQAIVDKLTTESKNITSQKGTIMFAIVNGKVLGIRE